MQNLPERINPPQSGNLMRNRPEPKEGELLKHNNWIMNLYKYGIPIVMILTLMVVFIKILFY